MNSVTHCKLFIGGKMPLCRTVVLALGRDPQLQTTGETDLQISVLAVTHGAPLSAGQGLAETSVFQGRCANYLSKRRVGWEMPVEEVLCRINQRAYA